jgi:ACS family hexuronate transporter-like MFS transporter
MLFAGRIIDWLGTKSGYAWSLIVWSVGAMVHALAKGTGGFMIARGVLGLGEAGNFPAAIKTTAEWFPKRDRALATGIFNSGTNVGAILAPLTVPWLALNWGWQGTFIVVGGIGFLWLIFWFWLYDTPLKQKRLTKAEYDYIHSDVDEQIVAAAEAKAAVNNEPKLAWYVEWSKLLGYRQTWAFAFGKFMTDGVWWFFLFWLPAYLKAQYGMTGTDIAIPIAVLYTMTCVGSIGGGWFPIYFINRGYEPHAGHAANRIYSARRSARAAFRLYQLLGSRDSNRHWRLGPPGVVSQYLYHGFGHVSQEGGRFGHRHRRDVRRLRRHHSK